ncbi:hypothetical protein J2755_000275 [Methanohalophilus levihalophilus]|uniref:hypothetical protein n=1 Tax=Methanohalophilus levihalophilus TaxID=1431282 RepID=UPI001AEAD673|nr:hypothetical protein [Methanohalophilus levihalophilus]MBP2029355.1 hypothetical protein [Methanohalophilus levihalophilus]
MNYKLRCERLNTIQPGDEILKTSVSRKYITLQDRGDGEVQAVFLEPVKDLRYNLETLFEGTMLLFSAFGLGVLLSISFFFVFGLIIGGDL